MSALAIERLHAVAAAYSNLELDLATKERGSRYSHVEGLLRRLTGAEDALVVNNNAAAVLLALETLAHGREVVVSRGELIEIAASSASPTSCSGAAPCSAKSGRRTAHISGTTPRRSVRAPRSSSSPHLELPGRRLHR